MHVTRRGPHLPTYLLCYISLDRQPTPHRRPPYPPIQWAALGGGPHLHASAVIPPCQCEYVMCGCNSAVNAPEVHPVCALGWCRRALKNNTSNSGSRRCKSFSQTVTFVAQLCSRCPTRSMSTHVTQAHSASTEAREKHIKSSISYQGKTRSFLSLVFHPQWLVISTKQAFCSPRITTSPQKLKF